MEEGEFRVDKSQQGAHRGVSQELQRVQAVGGAVELGVVFFFLFFIFSFGFESKTLPHGIQAKMAAGLGRLEHAASLPVSPGLGGGHWAP